MSNNGCIYCSSNPSQVAFQFICVIHLNKVSITQSRNTSGKYENLINFNCFDFIVAVECGVIKIDEMHIAHQTIYATSQVEK